MYNELITAFSSVSVGPVLVLVFLLGLVDGLLQPGVVRVLGQGLLCQRGGRLQLLKLAVVLLK